MAIQVRTTLKGWFSKGKYPTQQQFTDLIDSLFHRSEDKLDISKVQDLQGALDSKASKAEVANKAVFYEFSSGALEAGVTKTIVHGQNLSGYMINARAADNTTNAMLQVLMPNGADPDNAIDIESPVAIDGPGLIIQIVGLRNT